MIRRLVEVLSSLPNSQWTAAMRDSARSWVNKQFQKQVQASLLERSLSTGHLDFITRRKWTGSEICKSQPII